MFQAIVSCGPESNLELIFDFDIDICFGLIFLSSIEISYEGY